MPNISSKPSPEDIGEQIFTGKIRNFLDTTFIGKRTVRFLKLPNWHPQKPLLSIDNGLSATKRIIETVEYLVLTGISGPVLIYAASAAIVGNVKYRVDGIVPKK